MHAWRSFVRSVLAPSHDAVSRRVGKVTFSDRLTRRLVFRVNDRSRVAPAGQTSRNADLQ